MAILDWVSHNWYWCFGGWAIAVAIFAGFVARDYIRTERAALAVRDNLALAVARTDAGTDLGTFSDSDSDGDRNSPGGTVRAAGRHAGQRPVFGVDGVGGAGRHSADSDPVRADAQAVA